MTNSNQEAEATNQHGLPESFRPLLWSYVFEEMDPNQHQHEIIVNAINYGDLVHWRWLVDHYSLEAVKRQLTTAPVTEIRQHVRRLVALLFGLSNHEFNYAPRGAH